MAPDTIRAHDVSVKILHRFRPEHSCPHHNIFKKRRAVCRLAFGFSGPPCFNLELGGHMQVLHELSVRKLFQEACSQTLHSHACCLNYSMEVDLCIEAVSEIYLLALPLFRSRVGVVGAHDFICKASPATPRPPCDILHQPRTKKQLRI